MADTLVERVTGLADADAVSVAVNLVLSDETLMGGDDPATLSDYGPIPAEIACRPSRRPSPTRRRRPPCASCTPAPAPAP